MIIKTNFPLGEGLILDVKATMVRGEIDELEITSNGEAVDLSKIAIFPWAQVTPVPAEDLVAAHVYAEYTQIAEDEYASV